MIVSVDPGTAEAKGAFLLDDAFGHDLLDFHFELLMGAWGGTFVSVLGILLVAFAGTGLWLWWPRKGYLWRKARTPALRGRPRDKLFQLHGWLGVWTALLVVLFAISGTALARPSWFGPAIADAHAREPEGGAWSRTCGISVTPDEAARIAQSRFPTKRVSTVLAQPGEPIHIYMRGMADLNTIEGDGLVWVHATCRGLVAAIDGRDLAPSERLGGMVHSLHGGYSFGPVIGPLLVLLTGGSLVFFAVSGVIVFFTRTLRKSEPKGRTGYAIAAE